MLLTRDDILKAEDLQTKDVDLTAHWGGIVRVRSMTAATKGRFEQKMMGKSVDYSTVLAEYAAAVLVGEDGKPLFTAKDIAALAEKSAAALQIIFDEAQALNALSQADIEGLAKN